MYIYCITNKINNKKYIGQTTASIQKRFKDHCRSKNTIIGKSIKKYGINNFKIELLTTCKTINELNKFEILSIKQYNTLNPNGYNMTTGGRSHGKMSKLTKEKMSKAHMGKKSWNKGQKCPQISKSCKGRKPWNKGLKNTYKMSTKHKDILKTTNKNNTYAGKTILCLTNNKRYLSISRAAKDLNLNRAWLAKQISKNKTHKGYRFQYENISTKQS